MFFLGRRFVIAQATARTGLESPTQLFGVVRGEAAVPEEGTIAYGTGDVGFDFGFLVGTVFATALETRSSLTGMMTGVIHVEGLVA